MASFDSLKPLERSCLYNCRLLAGGKPGLKIASKGPSLQNFASTFNLNMVFRYRNTMRPKRPKKLGDCTGSHLAPDCWSGFGGQEVKGGPCHQGFPPVTGSPGHSRGRQSLSWRMRMLRQGSCRTESKRSKIRSGLGNCSWRSWLSEIGCSVHVKKD